MQSLNESEIFKWFEIFKGFKNNKADMLTEIRLINSEGYTASGYFDNIYSMLDAIRPYADRYNVYFTVNSINPECMGRPQYNKIIQRPKQSTTDSEIIARDWVYIDLDSKRASGINATDEQIAKTKQKANEVYKFLKDNGFYDPIVIFSSNGVHLYLRCAMRITEENNLIVKRFIQSLSMIFSDDDVEVDTSVFNPARIARLPGSYSRKGNNIDPARPQRLCQVVKFPNYTPINHISYFEKVANIFPEDNPIPNRFNGYSTERFDLETFIEKHHIPVTGKKVVAEGTRYYLEHCLFDSNHKGKDAVLFQRNNGAVSYFCFHNSCAGNDWRKVRLMYEPNAYNRKWSDYPRRKEYFQETKKFVPIVPNKEQGEVWLKMSQIRRPDFNLADYIPTGVQQIDDLMIGFKRKHVSVWSGYRGCGKSSLLNMLILNAANQGYKSALWTGELDGDEEKKWLYLQAAGKTYNRQARENFFYTPDDVCKMIDPWIDKYFWIFNNNYGNDFENILDEIRKLVEKECLDMVVLDNLMTLNVDGLDGDKYDKQKNLMIELTNLARELNIHIHIVAHPNKSGTFLRPNNISGSGHIPDLAQNVFIIHRINQDFAINAAEFLSRPMIAAIDDSNCTNCIEICKCRDKGTAADQFIKLYFEVESNRLKNDIAENLHYEWETPDDVPSEIAPTTPQQQEWYNAEIETSESSFMGFLDEENENDSAF